MKIISFAGSNSTASINHQLVTFASSLMEDAETIRLNNYDLPMYNIDTEQSDGIPNEVKRLANDLSVADAFIISVAEHNGNVSSFFKNCLDWLSRNERDFLKGKKIIILSTSPGGRGGQNALETTAKMLPYFGGEIVGKMSIGEFNAVFQEGKIINEDLLGELKRLLSILS